MFTYSCEIYKMHTFPNKTMPTGETASGEKVGNLHPFLKNSA